MNQRNYGGTRLTPTIPKAICALQWVTEQRGKWTVRDFSSGTEIPQRAAYRWLLTIERAGWVCRERFPNPNRKHLYRSCVGIINVRN